MARSLAASHGGGAGWSCRPPQVAQHRITALKFTFDQLVVAARKWWTRSPTTPDSPSPANRNAEKNSDRRYSRPATRAAKAALSGQVRKPRTVVGVWGTCMTPDHTGIYYILYVFRRSGAAPEAAIPSVSTAACAQACIPVADQAEGTPGLQDRLRSRMRPSGTPEACREGVPCKVVNPGP